MWNNVKIFCRWFRKVMKMNIAFRWFWLLLKFFLFEWRFADWPWNVVILSGFQVPVPYFDLIFGICDTCTCDIIWTIISGSSLVFSFFREKHWVLFSVLRILPEWRWSPGHAGAQCIHAAAAVDGSTAGCPRVKFSLQRSLRESRIFLLSRWNRAARWSVPMVTVDELQFVGVYSRGCFDSVYDSQLWTVWIGVCESNVQNTV